MNFLQLLIERHKSALLEALKISRQEDRSAAAGHLAFMTLLSFFPFCIFLLTITSWVGQNYKAGRFLEAFLSTLPTAIATALSKPLSEAAQLPSGWLLALTIVIAIWISSSGIEALRQILDRAFGLIEYRSPIYRRVQSLFFVLMAPGPVVGLIAIVIFVPEIWQRVLMDLELQNQSYFDLQDHKRTGRYLLISSAIYLSVHALFQFLPARKLRITWVYPGAILTTLLWFAVGLLFPKLFGAFFKYEMIYGSLAGLILTLIFFYILCLILIFGAEYNASLARQDGLKRDNRRHPGQSDNAPGRAD